MSENLINAFKELERFAAAKARGAGVVLLNGHSRLDCTQPDVGLRVGADTLLSGYRIEKIIEPAVLRDWTAEDAKKHVGFAWRRTKGQAGGIIGAGIHSWCPWGRKSPVWEDWSGCEYAAPIPGTDPAKWDWKPCKVEVPATEVETESAYLLRVMSEMTTEAWINQRQWIIGRLSNLLSESP